MKRIYLDHYHGIGISYESQCIRVRNDEALDRYMRSVPHAGFRLASFIKKAYLYKNAEPLKISLDSLAIELYGHYYLQVLFLRLNRLSFLARCRSFRKLSDWMLLHMDVIDCADRPNDNNRWLWDLIAVLPVRWCNTAFHRLRLHLQSSKA